MAERVHCEPEALSQSAEAESLGRLASMRGQFPLSDYFQLGYGVLNNRGVPQSPEKSAQRIASADQQVTILTV